MTTDKSPPAQASDESMRQAFEAAHMKHYPLPEIFPRFDDGAYIQFYIEERYQGWLLAQVTPAEGVSEGDLPSPTIIPLPKPELQLSNFEGSETYPVFNRNHMHSFARAYGRAAIAADQKFRAALKAQPASTEVQGEDSARLEWISVEDRLPEPEKGRQISGNVLAINMESVYPTVQISELIHFTNESCWRAIQPTHWMPLPAAPQPKEHS